MFGQRQNNTVLCVLCVLIGVLCVGMPHSTFADQQDASATVNVTVAAICGNGVIEGAETCDDGNRENQDGCSSSCLTEGGGVGGVGGGGGGAVGGGAGAGAGGDGGAGAGDGGAVGGDAGAGADVGGDVGGDAGAGADVGGDVGGVDGGADVGGNDGGNNGGNVGGDGGAGAGDGGAVGGDAGAGAVGGGAGAGAGAGAAAGAGGNAGVGAVGGGTGGSGGGGSGGGGGAGFPINNTRGNPELSVSPESLFFLVGNNDIAIDFIDGYLEVLTGSRVTIGIGEEQLPDAEISDIVIQVSGIQYALQKRERSAQFLGSIIAPAVGTHEALLIVKYADGKMSVRSFFIKSLGYGIITDAETNEPIAGARVQVFDRGRLAATIFPGAKSSTTGDDGLYAFIAPLAKYQIRVTKDGYRARVTPTFSVRNAVVNKQLELIKKTPSIQDVIRDDASLGTNIVAVTKNIGDKIVEQSNIVQEVVGDTINIVQEAIDDPMVEEVNERVLAPTVVGISAVAVVPSFFSIFFPLLRFLFLQPLLFIGKRERKEWGTVYNSLTKLPIDLATVRLISGQTKKIIQSMVTDGQGRFWFAVEPGTYTIEVMKQRFVFPSALLKDVTIDGERLDIYHGETITVSEEALIAPNIPVDPVGETKTPRRIVWEKQLRSIQFLVSILGIVATLISLYVTPSLLIFGFLCIHIALFALFFRFVKPKKPKGWGLVYESKTRKPVGRVVARLFTKQYNKLVATQVTDNKGRYAFLVGPNEYYIMYDKKGYKEVNSGNITINEKQGTIIKRDVGIEKQGNKSEKQKTVENKDKKTYEEDV